MRDNAAPSLVRVGPGTGAAVVVRPSALFARNIILLKGGIANVPLPLNQRSTGNLRVQHHCFFVIPIDAHTQGAVAGLRSPYYIAAVHMEEVGSAP